MRDSLSWRDTSSKGVATGLATNSAFQVGGPTGAVEDAAIVYHLPPNLIVTAPYMASNSQWFDHVGVDVTAVGSRVWVGIYRVNCGTSMLPGARDETVVISVGATGVRTTVASVRLVDRTLWWVAALAVSSVRLVGYDANYLPPIFGYDTDSVAIGFSSVVASWAFATGLPATFPTAVTYVGTDVPAIGWSLRAHG